MKSNTHDLTDGEAAIRPTLRSVLVKEWAQRDFQVLHRVREWLVNAWTALMHKTRGWLSAYGIILPQGVTTFRRGLLPTLEQTQAKQTTRGRAIFQQLSEEWLALEERLAYDNGQLEAMCRAHPVCQRLLTIPGIGPFTATT